MSDAPNDIEVKPVPAQYEVEVNEGWPDDDPLAGPDDEE